MYNYFFECMFSLDTKMSSDSIINCSPVEEASQRVQSCSGSNSNAQDVDSSTPIFHACVTLSVNPHRVFFSHQVRLIPLSSMCTWFTPLISQLLWAIWYDFFREFPGCLAFWSICFLSSEHSSSLGLLDYTQHSVLADVYLTFTE